MRSYIYSAVGVLGLLALGACGPIDGSGYRSPYDNGYHGSYDPYPRYDRDAYYDRERHRDHHREEKHERERVRQLEAETAALKAQSDRERERTQALEAEVARQRQQQDAEAKALHDRISAQHARERREAEKRRRDKK